MNIIVVLLIIILLSGGVGYGYNPYAGGFSLVGLIVLLLILRVLGFL